MKFHALASLLPMVSLLFGCSADAPERTPDEPSPGESFDVPPPKACSSGACVSSDVSAVRGELLYASITQDVPFVDGDVEHSPKPINVCHMTLDAHSVAVVRVVGEVDTRDQCPLEFRSSSRTFPIEVEAVVGGHAVPQTLTLISVKGYPLHEWKKGELYLANLRELGGRWFTFLSVPIELVDTMVAVQETDSPVDLASDPAVLASDVARAYSNYGDESVCPEHIRWWSEADAYAFLTDTSGCTPNPADEPLPTHPGED